MRKVLLTVGIVLLIVLVGGSGRVLGLERSFKVTLSGTVNINQNTASGTAVGTLVGQGQFVLNATPLPFNFSNDIPSSFGCNPFTADLFIATQVGQLINIRLYGAACNVLVTPDQGQVAGGMYRIVGGSGRFQGASGVGTFSGELPAGTASLVATLEGTINLPSLP